MTTDELIVYEKIRDMDREAARMWQNHIDRIEATEGRSGNTKPPSMTPQPPLELLKDLRLTL